MSNEYKSPFSPGAKELLAREVEEYKTRFEFIRRLIGAGITEQDAENIAVYIDNGYVELRKRLHTFSFLKRELVIKCVLLYGPYDDEVMANTKDVIHDFITESFGLPYNIIWHENRGMIIHLTW